MKITTNKKPQGNWIKSTDQKTMLSRRRDVLGLVPRILKPKYSFSVSSPQVVRCSVPQPVCMFSKSLANSLAQRQIIIKTVPRKGPSKITILMVLVGGAVVLYLASCVERMPVTGRYRMIFWSPETESFFGDQAFQVFARNALPPNHKVCDT